MGETLLESMRQMLATRSLFTDTEDSMVFSKLLPLLRTREREKGLQQTLQSDAEQARLTGLFRALSEQVDSMNRVFNAPAIRDTLTKEAADTTKKGHFTEKALKHFVGISDQKDLVGFCRLQKITTSPDQGCYAADIKE